MCVAACAAEYSHWLADASSALDSQLGVAEVSHWMEVAMWRWRYTERLDSDSFRLSLEFGGQGLGRKNT